MAIETTNVKQKRPCHECNIAFFSTAGTRLFQKNKTGLSLSFARQKTGNELNPVSQIFIWEFQQVNVEVSTVLDNLYNGGRRKGEENELP